MPDLMPKPQVRHQVKKGRLISPDCIIVNNADGTTEDR